MESDRMSLLVSKYFDGETTIGEEIELKKYFSSSDVSANLLQYKPLFVYLSVNANQKFEKAMPTLQHTSNPVKWLSIAASAVVLLGIGIYAFNNFSEAKTSTELGTFDDPQVAFEETQKALAMLSNHVNTGIESVRYVQTYEDTRDKVFVAEN
ncbi:MAG: hypothetical protein IPP30_10175 [Flavobacterium sp.]|nr:hypothetical protein [Flavobacterium sp.]